jgi:hypothetical protein
MILISVDLPAPFSPISAWTSPAPSAIDAPASAWVDPKRRNNPRTSISGCPLGLGCVGGASGSVVMLVPGS